MARKKRFLNHDDFDSDSDEEDRVSWDESDVLGQQLITVDDPLLPSTRVTTHSSLNSTHSTIGLFSRKPSKLRNNNVERSFGVPSSALGERVEAKNRTDAPEPITLSYLLSLVEKNTIVSQETKPVIDVKGSKARKMRVWDRKSYDKKRYTLLLKKPIVSISEKENLLVKKPIVSISEEERARSKARFTK